MQEKLNGSAQKKATESPINQRKSMRSAEKKFGDTVNKSMSKSKSMAQNVGATDNQSEMQRSYMKLERRNTRFKLNTIN